MISKLIHWALYQDLPATQKSESGKVIMLYTVKFALDVKSRPSWLVSIPFSMQNKETQSSDGFMFFVTGDLVAGTGQGSTPGCTLDIKAALSACMPLWTAASLDSAMRMVQRYEAYCTNERHWSLRPQVLCIPYCDFICCTTLNKAMIFLSPRRR